MLAQMIRVISSPSISTTGFTALTRFAVESRKKEIIYVYNINNNARFELSKSDFHTLQGNMCMTSVSNNFNLKSWPEMHNIN